MPGRRASHSPYEVIGQLYSRHRRADPRIAAQIDAALGDAKTVLDVGAGTGSYEPRGRVVVACEPSSVMISQRPPGSAPAVRSVAESLPFASGSFDAVLAVLTVHHWSAPLVGLREIGQGRQTGGGASFRPGCAQPVLVVRRLPARVQRTANGSTAHSRAGRRARSAPREPRRFLFPATASTGSTGLTGNVPSGTSTQKHERASRTLLSWRTRWSPSAWNDSAPISRPGHGDVVTATCSFSTP